MAQAALAARARGDVRWDLLLMQLSLATELPFNEVEARIVALSKGQPA